MCRLLAAALLLLSTSGAVLAHEYSVGDMEIGHPYAVETAKTAKTAAGYLSIANGGSEADRLVAVETAFPMTQIHAVETDAQGVTRMVHQENGIEIPAGETVTLAPNGLHVMFMGLTAPLVAGTSFPATLVFEHAGKLDIEFKVETREKAGDMGAMPGMSH